MWDILLFICGRSGHEALCFLGEENVKCFCDNDLNVANGGKREKTVLFVAEIKAIVSVLVEQKH